MIEDLDGSRRLRTPSIGNLDAGAEAVDTGLQGFTRQLEVDFQRGFSFCRDVRGVCFHEGCGLRGAAQGQSHPIGVCFVVGCDRRDGRGGVGAQRDALGLEGQAQGERFAFDLDCGAQGCRHRGIGGRGHDELDRLRADSRVAGDANRKRERRASAGSQGHGGDRSGHGPAAGEHRACLVGIVQKSDVQQGDGEIDGSAGRGVGRRGIELCLEADIGLGFVERVLDLLERRFVVHVTEIPAVSGGGRGGRAVAEQAHGVVELVVLLEGVRERVEGFDHSRSARGESACASCGDVVEGQPQIRGRLGCVVAVPFIQVVREVPGGQPQLGHDSQQHGLLTGRWREWILIGNVEIADQVDQSALVDPSSAWRPHADLDAGPAADFEGDRVVHGCGEVAADGVAAHSGGECNFLRCVAGIDRSEKGGARASGDQIHRRPSSLQHETVDGGHREIERRVTRCVVADGSYGQGQDGSRRGKRSVWDEIDRRSTHSTGADGDFVRAQLRIEEPLDRIGCDGVAVGAGAGVSHLGGERKREVHALVGEGDELVVHEIHRDAGYRIGDFDGDDDRGLGPQAVCRRGADQQLVVTSRGAGCRNGVNRSSLIEPDRPAERPDDSDVVVSIH